MKGCCTFWLYLALSSVSGVPKTEWRPQLGTITYPKDIDRSPHPIPGDVYRVNDVFYKCKQKCTFSEDTEILGACDLLSSTMFKPLRRGSYYQPKLSNIDRTVMAGDIILHQDSNVLYRALKPGSMDTILNFQSLGDTFDKLDVKAQWMTLIADELGDRRLGDVIIPGTHDSATDGINDQSYLVDNNFLFQLAVSIEPQIIANWSLTHQEGLAAQLAAGFREFDLRIADMEEEDGTFRWWHGMTGDTIEEGLDEIAQFAATHPQEVVVLLFQNFAKPGDSTVNTQPIPESRKDVLADILIQKLSPYMVPRGALGNNPTFNEILARGKNLVVLMKDSYIRAKHPGFWSSIILEGFSPVTNPEDLFVDRSNKLRNYRMNHRNRVTDISAALTPGETNIIAGLLLKYGDDDSIRDIISIILPEILEVNPEMLSFEGLFMDLLFMARDGVNDNGMLARPQNLYGSGASVHFRGVNEMLPYWIARPQLYKPNIVYVDDFASSTIVETAIAANLGEIPREVAIVYQGNSMNGYYEWDELHAIRGNESLNCMPAFARFSVTSESYYLETSWVSLNAPESVTFQEGEYPPDAKITVQISYDGNVFVNVYEHNIQDMIANNFDTYLRAGITGDNEGYYYLSSLYNSYGENCNLPPAKLK